jgi:hypothetical protein
MHNSIKIRILTRDSKPTDGIGDRMQDTAVELNIHAARYHAKRHGLCMLLNRKVNITHRLSDDACGYWKRGHGD